MQFITWHFGVGDSVGDIVGDVVGDIVGFFVGDVVGDIVGDVVGFFVGDVVGFWVGEVVGEVVGAFVITHLAGRFGVPPNPSYPALHDQSQDSLTLCVFPHVVWCALEIGVAQASHEPAWSPWQLKRNSPTLQYWHSLHVLVAATRYLCIGQLTVGDLVG
jgi:hypothetical protein